MGLQPHPNQRGEKTQIWNRGGHVPTDRDVLLVAARREDPEAQICFGDLQLPAALRAAFMSLGHLWARQNVCRHSSRTPWSPMRCCGPGSPISVFVAPLLRIFESIMLFACLQSHTCRNVRSTTRFAGVAVFLEHHWPVASPGNVGVGQPSSSPWRSRHSERLSHGPCRTLGSTIREFHSNIAEIMSEALSTHLPLLFICKGLCKLILFTVGFTTPGVAPATTRT